MRVMALTPPYHFSIVACTLGPTTNSTSSPTPCSSSSSSSSSSSTSPAQAPQAPLSSLPQTDNSQILYRGSIPTARNASFLRRLKIKTILYLRKKPFKEDEPFLCWAEKKRIDTKWVKADSMGEEKLGMGRTDVSDVLKLVLNPSAYPIYLADSDGISHTTLVVACLRKLQGWHMDSIISEISRYQPYHEDYPLVSFVNSYFAPTSSSSAGTDTIFTLPPPPYPTWLWPVSTSSQTSLPVISREQRDRERSHSGSSTVNQPSHLLPFPHPLTVRRHPSMRLSFPASSVPVTGSTSVSNGVNSGSKAGSNRALSSGGVSRERSVPVSPREEQQFMSLPGNVTTSIGAIETTQAINSSSVNQLAGAMDVLSENQSLESNVLDRKVSFRQKRDKVPVSISVERPKVSQEIPSILTNPSDTVTRMGVEAKYAEPRPGERLREDNGKVSSPLRETQREAEADIKMTMVDEPAKQVVMDEHLDGRGEVEMEGDDDDDEAETDDEYDNDEDEDDEDEEEDDDCEEDDEDYTTMSQYLSALDLASPKLRRTRSHLD